MNLTVLIAVPLLPLLAALIAGLAGRLIGRAGAHTVTCAAVTVSCALSLMVLKQIYWGGVPAYEAPVYTWLVSDGMHMEVGFLIDRLTALMMAVVTFVSLCVHVYTIGYMSDDPGYTRFFSYISLLDRKSTRLNSSHLVISYAVFCLKKKKRTMYYRHLVDDAT